MINKVFIPIISLIFFSISVCANQNEKKEIADVIEKTLQFAYDQSLLMAEELKDKSGLLPKTIDESGNLLTCKPSWWVSGFFPGQLWYLYEFSKNEGIKNWAINYTSRVEGQKHTTGNHDVGFILECSFGNGYRLTNEKSYADVLIKGSHSLTTRYNHKIGLIRSWDFNKETWQYPVIIDNMMNLELLMNAFKITGDSIYYHIAVSHADKTITHHFRDDYSTWHVVSYDTITGIPHLKSTFQGFNDESSWARGQAWALYGFSMMYRETGKKSYLNQAIGIADFIINHPNLPADLVPFWDFNDPKIPNTYRDVSAAAIIASALIELSNFDETINSQLYLNAAKSQIMALASPTYLAKLGENGNFILKHSVGHLPANSEIDVPLTYADYYFVEALIRMRRMIK